MIHIQQKVKGSTMCRAMLENGVRSETENTTKKCCSGLCVDLLRKFEDDLGFTYDLTRVRDPKWGTLEVSSDKGVKVSMTAILTDR